jgi:ribokinase
MSIKAVVVGAINWDVNLFVKNFPRKGHQTVIQQITRVPGGKAGNVAVAAARLLGPDHCAVLGSVGKDTVGSEQIRIFQQEGVVVSGIKYDQHTESGQAYIVVDQHGENIIHSLRGANSNFLPEDLDDPARRELISAASVVVIMDSPIETSLALAEVAKRQGKIVAWDPGVKSQLGMKGTEGLLKNVDYVAANACEIEDLTGTRTPTEAARRLINVNSDLKIITKMGSKGCILHHGSVRTVCKGLDVKSLGLNVVNTVGCGDTLLGAFAAALCEGLSDKEALEWGNCAAALKATREETRGSPNRKTLMNFLTRTRASL